MTVHIPSANTHLLLIHAAEKVAMQLWLWSVRLETATGAKYWHGKTNRGSASIQHSTVLSPAASQTFRNSFKLSNSDHTAMIFMSALVSKYC